MYRNPYQRYALDAKLRYFMHFFENKGVAWESEECADTLETKIMLRYSQTFLNQEGEDETYTAEHRIKFPSCIGERSLMELLQQAWVDLEYKSKQAIKNYLEEGYFE